MTALQSGAELRDACGIFGCIRSCNDTVMNSVDAARLTVDALGALQHRGTEGSGLVGMYDGRQKPFTIHKGMGLVREIYLESEFKKFAGTRACIGHNRYSTSGKKDGINCIQPFVVHTVHGLIAVAHNGELVLHTGVGLSTDTDSELIAQMLAKTLAKRAEDNALEADISQEIVAVMAQLTLSYSLLIMTPNHIYAVRDPWGNRPLTLGIVESTDNGAPLAYLAASETSAFSTPVRHLRDVRAGEIVLLSSDAPPTTVGFYRPHEVQKQALCIFEYVYFARPDTIMDGVSVWQARYESGAQLAREFDAAADVVSNVPESANPAAQGYADQLNIPYKSVFSRNAYVGRSFIQPSTALRQSAVARKFGVLGVNFVGARVVLVDDSIVRGNTMKPIVKLLRDNGAKEVHIRIASPPVRHPCYMGINIPSRDELIAAKNSVEEIRQHMGADSLAYLSVEGLKAAVDRALLVTHASQRSVQILNRESKALFRKKTDNNDERTIDDVHEIERHCTACFTGDYPSKPCSTLLTW